MLLNHPSTNGVTNGAATRKPWAWAGSASQFASLDAESFLETLTAHHAALTGEQPSESQLEAWRTEREVLKASLETFGVEPTSWNLVFEFELPFEGGRRPDVVVVAGQSVVVLEFKGVPVAGAAQRDQVEAYARDLREYHEASHWRNVFPVLVLTSSNAPATAIGDLQVCGMASLADVLRTLASDGQIDFEEWLSAPYAPLPSLVSAARRIFQHERLPHVRRALAARIPETVKLVDDLILEGRREGQRRLVLVTGVPGAGKTLVGLRIVYERAEAKAESTFLSGNGPLVKVLQSALASTVFVRDLHKFIGSYAASERVPEQNVIVFDEAQRAWDGNYMLSKKGVAASEPELLIGIAGRIEPSATLVGLVGTGQAIYSGEEGGLGLWRDAITSSQDDWEVFGPPALSPEFAGLEFVPNSDLELDVTLRSRQADELHAWVARLLEGDLAHAEVMASTIDRTKFPIYLTRELEEAREYAVERYSGEPDPRYGLLASSHAKNLESQGVDNSWIATSRMNLAKWFNAPPTDPLSCCALAQPVTEFGCQGLELDLPIVCWGDDLRWQTSGWDLRPRRRQYPIDNPAGLLRNTYRVLLTRGRDGLVLWVPPQPELDETASALELAGADSHWLRSS